MEHAARLHGTAAADTDAVSGAVSYGHHKKGSRPLRTAPLLFCYSALLFGFVMTVQCRLFYACFLAFMVRMTNSVPTVSAVPMSRLIQALWMTPAMM